MQKLKIQATVLSLVLAGVVSTVAIANHATLIHAAFIQITNRYSKTEANKPDRLKLDEIVSVQILLNSPIKNPQPFRSSNPQDEEMIAKIVNWINAAQPIEGAITYSHPTIGPKVLELELKNGKSVDIEPAVDSTTTKLSNGSIQIQIHGAQGQIIYHPADGKPVRLEAPELYDWLYVKKSSEHPGECLIVEKSRIVKGEYHCQYISGKRCPATQKRLQGFMSIVGEQLIKELYPLNIWRGCPTLIVLPVGKSN